jgi:hypothetical protein
MIRFKGMSAATTKKSLEFGMTNTVWHTEQYQYKLFVALCGSG